MWNSDWEYPDMAGLVGLTVHRVVSYGSEQAFMFTDRKTFLLFSEQDYYENHDCDSSARCLTLVSSAREWEEMEQSWTDIKDIP